MSSPLVDRLLLAMMSIVVAFLPMSFGLSANWRTWWFQALVVTLAAHLVTGRCRFDRRVAWWALLAAMALGSALVTAGATAFPVAHRRAAATLLVSWLLAAPVIASVVARPVARRAAVLAFVIGQTVSAVVGTVAVLAGDPTLGATAEPDRAYGLAGHPNVFALGASAVCLWAVRQRSRPSIAGSSDPGGSGAGPWRRTSWILAGVVVVNGAGVVWSGSMSVVLALTVAMAVDLAVRRAGPRRVVATIAAAAGIASAAAVVAVLTGTRTPWSRFEQAVGQAELESSLSERWRTWGFALREIGDRPLHGVGLAERSGVTDVNDLVVHQLVLRGWYQGGPLLGLAMAAVTLSCILLVVRAIRRGHVGPAPAIMALYVTFASTSATLQQPYFWLVLLMAWFVTAVETEADVGSRLYHRHDAAPAG